MLDTPGLLNKQLAKVEKRQYSSLGELRGASDRYQSEAWVKSKAGLETLNGKKKKKIFIPPEIDHRFLGREARSRVALSTRLT